MHSIKKEAINQPLFLGSFTIAIPVHHNPDASHIRELVEVRRVERLCRRYVINRLHAYLIIHNQQIFGSCFFIVTKNCDKFTFIEVVFKTRLLTHLMKQVRGGVTPFEFLLPGTHSSTPCESLSCHVRSCTY